MMMGMLDENGYEFGVLWDALATILAEEGVALEPEPESEEGD